MRGRPKQQTTLFGLRTPGDRVPAGHPLRRVKDMADAALAALSPTFDEMRCTAAPAGRASHQSSC
ncbi:MULTISPECIES: hypothetical protein [Corallococcus]|uniref:hypothetical protein n=1 Tax=Corallococcus TaxID=83461 RepID=UPI00163DDF59